MQLPRPPLSLSVFLPLIDTSLTLTEMERKREQEAGPFESGLWGVAVMVVGGCLYDDFSFEEKEKHQSSAGFCEGFNTALSPVVCVVVSSECYVFDMRVNNVLAGKCSVCVFTALHTPR